MNFQKIKKQFVFAQCFGVWELLTPHSSYIQKPQLLGLKRRTLKNVRFQLDGSIQRWINQFEFLKLNLFDTGIEKFK